MIMCSNLLYFAVLNLYYLFSQPLFVLVVEPAGMVLGHPVGVAKERTATTLHSKQSQLPTALIALILSHFLLDHLRGFLFGSLTNRIQRFLLLFLS